MKKVAHKAPESKTPTRPQTPNLVKNRNLSNVISDYYDLRTVAVKLGTSYDTVYNAVRAGGLPFVRLGKEYRIPTKFIDSLPDNAIAEFNNAVARS